MPTLGFLTVHALRAIRLFNPNVMANVERGGVADASGRGCRSIASAAPISPRHFRRSRPPRSRQILRGVWDNLGRVGAEFAHIDRLWDYDTREHGRGRITGFRRDRDRSRSGCATTASRR